MHFEILVEDQSGKRALDIVVPKLVSADDTFGVKAYKGIGRIPRDLVGENGSTKAYPARPASAAAAWIWTYTRKLPRGI